MQRYEINEILDDDFIWVWKLKSNVRHPVLFLMPWGRGFEI